MKKTAILVVLNWLFLITAGQADEVYDRCMEASSTNASWSACGTELLKRQDDQLNTLWKDVFERAKGKSRDDLLAEQRAWIAFKEASCRFYGNGEWGREGQVLQFPACRAEVIAERIRALEAYGTFFSRR